MIIQKAIYLNTTEPALLNVRAPRGLETKLDVTFFNQNGSPHNEDLAAQLQLTSRTGDQTIYYSMPSTDVVNGKTRAIIPADTLNDSNGYRLRITGTYQSEPALLALGTVYPTAAAGEQAVPLDVIDQISLTFERNEVVELDIRLWDDTAKTDPFDLTTTTISASVYQTRGGFVLEPFSATVTGPNTVHLSLTIEQVNGLPDSCWWSLAASGFVGLTTLAEGSVTVTGIAIPPLAETITNYDYVKPADADPASGQIEHGNITQNTLKVSKTDHDAVDQSAMLALVRAGDQILIGATTWTVGLAVAQVGWFEFTVLPVQQAAVTGVTPVTFRRPGP